ncbi:MAG TPA: oligopeptide/dipeptide ABC transporter ATP-binding protein [Candidatus Bipolaricaulota bacterium]
MNQALPANVSIWVQDVRKLFPVQKGLFVRGKLQHVHAVDHLDFYIQEGESFGLVGESGCGKTTTGSLLVRLLEPTSGHILMRRPQVRGFVLQQGGTPLGAISIRLDEEKRALSVVAADVAPGANPRHFKQQADVALSQLARKPEQLSQVKIHFGENGRGIVMDHISRFQPPSAAQNGRGAWDVWAQRARNVEFMDIAHLDGAGLKRFRRHVQMIFQDPYGSLNPRKTIYDIVAEPLKVQKIGSLHEREAQVMEMLEVVGLTPAESFMFRYPHELSGGQRQRVAVARAIIVRPTFVVADEPTSMLDVSIRTGVMRLMQNLQKEFGISYLYITHDLAVARYMCERIAVMYLGKIVEMGPTEEILQNPLHPYTRALISAVPVPDPAYKRQPIELKGSIPKPIDPHPRCRFYDRCPLASKRCEAEVHPALVDRGNGHFVACYEV